MSILVLLTIGFAAGCVAGIWFLSGTVLLYCALVCALGFAGLFFILPNDKRKRAAIVLLGIAIGGFWLFFYDSFYVNNVRKLDGEEKEVTIELTDYSTVLSSGTSGTGKIRLNDHNYKVQFYLNEKLELYPGETVTGLFKLRFTGYQGEDSPTYHQGKGIFLIAYAQDTVDYSVNDRISAKYFAVVIRKHILDKINAVFPQEQAGFARALLLGDTSGLSYEDDSALKISGIRHVVAVSGLHVSILMSLLYVITLRDRRLLAAVGLPLLFVFAAIAGFTPSVVRACVMQAMLIIANLVLEEYDQPTALAAAVLLLIALNPLVITSVSFQLSVGCVLGILLFRQKVYNAIIRKKPSLVKGKSLKAKLIRGAVSSVSITLSTQVITIPLCAHYFGAISLISVLTNLLTLWIVSICFLGVVVSCIVGFVFPSLSCLIALCVSWPMKLVMWIAGILSKVPFASVSAHNIYFLAWLVFCYILFALFLLLKKKPVFLFSSMAIVSLMVCIVFAYTEPRLDNYRMTVLDVGQGQCILLQSKNSHYVVDCGGDSAMGAADLAAQTLRSQGIRKIDGLILTHFDADHAGGAEYFLSQISVDNIYIPEAESAHFDEKFNNLYADCIQCVDEQIILDCGIGVLTIYPGEKGMNGNNSSLCILFQAARCDILITGDRSSSAERHLIDNYDIPQLDILVAGHHGAKSSTSLYLIQNTLPNTVAISVGKNNRNKHPSQEVLDRLELLNCTIWRTDLDGTIVFRG